MTRLVGEVLRQRAAERPDEEFVKCAGEGYLTFSELDRRSDRVAAGLASLGVSHGDRVAIILPNRMEMVELFFGCAKLGAVQVPLNYYLRGEFLRHQMRDCAASVLIADAPGYRAAAPLLASTEISTVITVDHEGNPDGPAVPYERVRQSTAQVPIVELNQQDLMSIIYTSGTTGLPKGCMLNHGYYTACGLAYGPIGWVIPGDRMFTAFPMFHLSGRAAAMMAALMCGASVCFEAAFHASSFLDRASEERASMIWGVVSMGLAILAQPERDIDASRRFRLACFTPMAAQKQEEFEARFGTPVMAEGYGQTECNPTTVSSIHGERNRLTSGRAAAFREVAIVDDHDNLLPPGEIGEAVVRPTAPDVMFSGYWGKPEATIETCRNLWHHTGDLGLLDQDGYFTFVDRKSDAMRRRGENVSSVELEAAIARYPGIDEVAVCAVPSELGEDDIMACVTTVGGAEFSIGDLFEFFKRELPYFAIPRYIQVRDTLPTNALGRIMKHQLRSEGPTPDTIDAEAEGFFVSREERRG